MQRNVLLLILYRTFLASYTCSHSDLETHICGSDNTRSPLLVSGVLLPYPLPYAFQLAVTRTCSKYLIVCLLIHNVSEGPFNELSLFFYIVFHKDLICFPNTFTWFCMFCFPMVEILLDF